jgi:hypothetical protein
VGAGGGVLWAGVGLGRAEGVMKKLHPSLPVPAGPNDDEGGGGVKSSNDGDKSACPALLGLVFGLMLVLVFGPGACESVVEEHPASPRVEGQP